MSARVSRCVPPKAVSQNPQRRKMVLEVDLNDPPCENLEEVGTSSHAPVIIELRGQQLPPPQPVPIDVDALDDDVILSSPRAFAEAKSNSRRNRGRSNNVIDVDLEHAGRHVANNRTKRQRVPTNQPIINCESYVILERNGHLSGKEYSLAQQSRSTVPPPPPPQEPTFSCPVCMGPLVEEMSTKCGHIFCKACIKKSIAAQGKCPTCRRKVTMKDTIRIYLPATNLT